MSESPKDEFVLVPREPNSEMLEAGYKAYGNTLYAQNSALTGWHQKATEIYRATLSAAPPVQMEPVEPLKLLKRPSAFRVLVNGRYHFFGDEDAARDFAERAQGGDYEGLYVRDGMPLNPTIEDVDDAADDLIDSVQYLQEALEAGEGVYESKWLGGVMRAHEMLIECSKRLALSRHPLPLEGGWQPIETAPRNRPVAGLTRAGKLVKMDWTMLGDDAVGWGAVDEDEHPSCWTDGFCWASNSDGEPSDPPVMWAELPRPMPKAPEAT